MSLVSVRRSMDYFKKGFTLVELSIVILIISLIISSVLVGQDLIKVAQVKALINQYQDFNSAVATFKVKYSAMPGDVKGATNYGFIGDGDENGYLSDANDLSKGENVFFWSHLGSQGAKLIGGAYLGTSYTANPDNLDAITPKAKAGSVNWGVYGDKQAGVNYYVIGIVSAKEDGKYNSSAALSALDAKAIDDKLDDGMPLRGLIVAGGAGNSAYVEPDQSCIKKQNGRDVYLTDDKKLSNIASCTLRLKIQ